MSEIDKITRELAGRLVQGMANITTEKDREETKRYLTWMLRKLAFAVGKDVAECIVDKNGDVNIMVDRRPKPDNRAVAADMAMKLLASQGTTGHIPAPDRVAEYMNEIYLFLEAAPKRTMFGGLDHAKPGADHSKDFSELYRAQVDIEAIDTGQRHKDETEKSSAFTSPAGTRATPSYQSRPTPWDPLGIHAETCPAHTGAMDGVCNCGVSGPPEADKPSALADRDTRPMVFAGDSHHDAGEFHRFVRSQWSPHKGPCLPSGTPTAFTSGPSPTYRDGTPVAFAGRPIAQSRTIDTKTVFPEDD